MMENESHAERSYDHGQNISPSLHRGTPMSRSKRAKCPIVGTIEAGFSRQRSMKLIQSAFVNGQAA